MGWRVRMTEDPKSRKITALAVDDKRPNLLAVEAVLSPVEVSLLTASSGHEAIALLEDRAAEVDVILMDLQMPGMDGFETTMRIKKMPQCETIPIVFITASYGDEAVLVQKVRECGGIDLFTKPFDPAELQRKVLLYGSSRRAAALAFSS